MTSSNTTVPPYIVAATTRRPRSDRPGADPASTVYDSTTPPDAGRDQVTISPLGSSGDAKRLKRASMPAGNPGTTHVAPSVTITSFETLVPHRDVVRIRV